MSGLIEHHILANRLIARTYALELIAARVPRDYWETAIVGKLIEVLTDDAVRLDIHLHTIPLATPLTDHASDVLPGAIVLRPHIHNVGLAVSVTLCRQYTREEVRATKRRRVAEDFERVEVIRQLVREGEIVLEEYLPAQFAILAQVVHIEVADVEWGGIGSLRIRFQFREVLQLHLRQEWIVLPCGVAYLILGHIVINPKLHVRVVVHEHTLAHIRHQVHELLLREVVRLVHIEPVASHTLCRLGVLVGVEEHLAA